MNGPPPFRRFRGRHAAALAGVVAAVLLVVVAGIYLRRHRPPAGAPPPPAVEKPPEEAPPPRLELTAARFAELPGWQRDDLAEALAAFRRSCSALARIPAGQTLGGAGYAGTAGDWREVCAAAPRVGDGTAAVRAFFESGFRPFAVRNRDDPQGLFTGYYEPTLNGSRRRHGAYQVPLYARPRELLEVDLGAFREDLAGRSIAGKIVGRELVPFADRGEIERGALAGRGLELVWVDDAVDAFFLEIQGSGRIRMEDGSEMRLGYAAQNGYPYYAIGRELIERGALSREEVSLQSIRRWLAEHPEQADEVMATNASYVFFRELDEEGPYGAQGVVLTPRRSLAVDRSFHALGVPVWLDATHPAPAAGDHDAGSAAEARARLVPLQRLLIAQDTGGAIRGPVRGDVFWGPGDEAEQIAGRMKDAGRMWLLLPRTLEGAPAAPASPAGR